MTFIQKQLGVAAAAAMLAICASPLHAQTEVYQGTIQSRPRLLVRAEHGNIDVHGKSGLTEVQWTVHATNGKRRPLNEAGISATTKGDIVEIRSSNADITVMVPMNFDKIRLQTDYGDLTLTDVTATAELISDGGSLTIDHVSGQVTGTTGGGAIALRSSGAAKMLSKLETGGGNVTIDAANGNMIATTSGGNVIVTAVRGDAKLESGGGNVTVRQASGTLQLETGSGNIEIGDIGGAATLETGSGSIRLASARGMVKASTGAGAIECRQLGSGLQAETGSGSITVEYAHTPHFAESRLQTGSGDVTVFLPDGLAAAVKLTADNPWGHTIRVDFPAIRLTSTHEDGELRAEGLMNGGGPLLRVETGNGSVALLRTK
jgi:DUF4097 and DUF4098 domain-containing protein YvlB